MFMQEWRNLNDGGHLLQSICGSNGENQWLNEYEDNSWTVNVAPNHPKCGDDVTMLRAPRDGAHSEVIVTTARLAADDEQFEFVRVIYFEWQNRWRME